MFQVCYFGWLDGCLRGLVDYVVGFVWLAPICFCARLIVLVLLLVAFGVGGLVVFV